MQNTKKPASNSQEFPDGLDEFVDPVKAEDSIPVFPAMKEKAPPVPPPVADQRPPVPPPVDACLHAKTARIADPPVQLPSRSSGSFNRKRRFPRRQLALAAAVLILFCFGLGSHDNTAPRFQSLETTQVDFSEPASSTRAQAGLGKHNTTTEYVVEELESDNAPPPSMAKALQAVETEAEDSKFAGDRAETVEVAKADIRLPNPSLSVKKESVEPTELADRAGELDASPKGESEVCELTLDTKQLLGTAVRWAETANEAAMIADDQGKLVYLIQVSGNFEIPEFT